MGYLELGFMHKAHELNVTKALSRVGCDVRCELRPILGPNFSPHIEIVVNIYNEGELAAQNLTGQWEFAPNYPGEKRVSQIRRDFLGRCEKYLDSYLIPESGGWGRQGAPFDVKIEFFYTIPGEEQTQYYGARYTYNRDKQQIVRQDV